MNLQELGIYFLNPDHANRKKIIVVVLIYISVIQYGFP